MALILEDELPGQVDPGNPSYPSGVPRNVTSPGAGDGTPWNAKIMKEVWGFFDALMAAAGINHSGDPETALESQYLQAILALPVQIANVVFPLGAKVGLANIFDSSTLATTLKGTIRNFPDTKNMSLISPLQKDIAATWAPGNAVGGVANGVTVPTGPLRKFLVAKPTGESDIMWDTDIAAANFFASTIADDEGYTDSSLYRRIDWSMTLGAGPTIEHYVNTPDRVNLHRRFDGNGAPQLFSMPTSAQMVSLAADAPPNTLLNFILQVHSQSGPDSYVLVTGADQSDSTPSATNATVHLLDNGQRSVVAQSVPGGTNAAVRVRGTNASDDFILTFVGFEDSLLDP